MTSTELNIPSRNKAYNLCKIDSKEKAYLIGYVAADGYILNGGDTVQFCSSYKDRNLIYFIAKYLNVPIYDRDVIVKGVSHKYSKCTKRISDINKFIKASKKVDRMLPYISAELVPYMVLGFFDADGCITWGRRKDRNRIWHKVSFTSSYNLLICLQNILLKEGFSTSIKPKGRENCSVLEFANKEQILKFYEYVYRDKTFIILNRKFNNYNALRFELGEFGETTRDSTIPSQATDHSVEGVETTGEKKDSLNNQLECPSL